MALETVIYNQETFGYGCKEYYNNNLGNFSYNYELGLTQGEGEMSFTNLLDHNNNNNREESSSSPTELMYNNNAREYNIWDPNSSLEDHHLFMEGSPAAELPAAAVRSAATSGRRKRRRTRSCKNKEELENQRMTHIAVERNRRKQMNEYLAVIRSLMPPSYVQRGDQASIIGGAINFVKELEHHLQTLEAQKRSHPQKQEHSDNHGSSSTPPFADYFAFPQYSTHSKSTSPTAAASDVAAAGSCNSPLATEKMSALADIEVSMAESHANLKILSKRRPKQLLKIVAGLQCLWLTVLHLNVTTVDHMVLYSLSLKLEEGCQLTTADEIADSVNQLLGRIQEEAASSS
uniref:BHLH domain-containing protein n=1 Tax=Solanum lycopersicum TaxID=4081 RepID=A0A3Q7G8Q1_SOLLC|nr:transcription factor bHLH94-like [Solanum lycopersicum]